VAGLGRQNSSGKGLFISLGAFRLLRATLSFPVWLLGRESSE